MGGLGVLIESEVNSGGSSLLEMNQPDRTIKEKVFYILSSLSYIVVGVMVILSEVRLRAFLNRAHFAETFLGRSLLQLFLGIEVLKQSEYLNTLEIEDERIHAITLYIGWSTIGAGFCTLLLHGLAVAPDPSDEEEEEERSSCLTFRGTLCARIIALVLCLGLAAAIPFLAATQGWNAAEVCACLPEWEHGAVQYRYCSEVPGFEEPWCYVRDECGESIVGLRNASGSGQTGQEEGEAEDAVRWATCDPANNPAPTAVPSSFAPLTMAPATRVPDTPEPGFLSPLDNTPESVTLTSTPIQGATATASATATVPLETPTETEPLSLTLTPLPVTTLTHTLTLTPSRTDAVDDGDMTTSSPVPSTSTTFAPTPFTTGPSPVPSTPIPFTTVPSPIPSSPFPTQSATLVPALVPTPGPAETISPPTQTLTLIPASLVTTGSPVTTAPTLPPVWGATAVPTGVPQDTMAPVGATPDTVTPTSLVATGQPHTAVPLTAVPTTHAPATLSPSKAPDTAIPTTPAPPCPYYEVEGKEITEDTETNNNCSPSNRLGQVTGGVEEECACACIALEGCKFFAHSEEGCVLTNVLCRVQGYSRVLAVGAPPKEDGGGSGGGMAAGIVTILLCCLCCAGYGFMRRRRAQLRNANRRKTFTFSEVKFDPSFELDASQPDLEEPCGVDERELHDSSEPDPSSSSFAWQRAQVAFASVVKSLEAVVAKKT